MSEEWDNQGPEANYGQVWSVACADSKTRTMTCVNHLNRWGMDPSFICVADDGYEAEVWVGYTDDPGNMYREGI